MGDGLLTVWAICCRPGAPPPAFGPRRMDPRVRLQNSAPLSPTMPRILAADAGDAFRRNHSGASVVAA